VTVLEVAPRILPPEDEAVSAAIRAVFAERGLSVVTGIQGIKAVERLPASSGALGGVRVHYQMGGQDQTLEAQAVILSTGWLGNLDSLNLEAAGVQTNGRYVLVDDALRTSARHIYAAGDITGRMMLVQSAGYEAVLAAENAVLGSDRREGHAIVPHGGFTDPEYASVGLTEAQARQQEDCVTAVVPFSELDRAVIDGHPVGLCKLIVSTLSHRILGAHVVGEQALEIIHLVAAGMLADMWVEQLAELEIAYPTFTAAVGIAARRIVADLGVRPLTPAWRALNRLPAEWEHGSLSG